MQTTPPGEAGPGRPRLLVAGEGGTGGSEAAPDGASSPAPSERPLKGHSPAPSGVSLG